MIESLKSAFILFIIFAMMAVVAWAVISRYDQFDLSRGVSSRVFQPDQQPAPEVMGENSEQTIEQEDDMAKPVDQVPNYPVLEVPANSRSIFAP